MLMLRIRNSKSFCAQIQPHRTELAGMYDYLAPDFAYTLRLSRKCKVYSFGVLSVEVITGIHPGEFIFSIATSSSVSSPSDILLIDILDKRKQTTTTLGDLHLLENLNVSHDNHTGSIPLICRKIGARS